MANAPFSEQRKESERNRRSAMRTLPVLLIALTVFLLFSHAARVRCPANAANVPGYARPTLASIGRQTAPRPAQVQHVRQTALQRAEEAAKKQEADRKRKERAEKRRRTAEERAREEQRRLAAAAAQLNVPALLALPAPHLLPNQVQPPLQPANQPNNQQEPEDEEEEEIELQRNEENDDNNVDLGNLNGDDNRNNLADPNNQQNGINNNANAGGMQPANGGIVGLQNNQAQVGALLQHAPGAEAIQTATEISNMLARILTPEDAQGQRRQFRTLVRRLHFQDTGIRSPEAFASQELNAIIGVFLLVRDISPLEAQRFVASALQQDYVEDARYEIGPRNTATVIMRVDSSAQGHNLVSADELVVGTRPNRYVYPSLEIPIVTARFRGVSIRISTINNALSDFIDQLLRHTGATSVTISSCFSRFTATFASPNMARIMAELLHGLLLQGALILVEQE